MGPQLEKISCNIKTGINHYKKEFGSSQKAISPIFATLIILAVVTVLFIPVFIWATGTASQNQESWQLSGTIATERIVVEEVNLKKDQPSCTIYVRNIGKTAVTVDNIFISEANGAGTIHVYRRTDTTVDIYPNSVVQGDLITVTIDLGFPVISTTYIVKVATTRGVSDECEVVT